MLDFNTSLERYNSNGYRTPFIFILGSIDKHVNDQLVINCNDSRRPCIMLVIV